MPGTLPTERKLFVYGLVFSFLLHGAALAALSLTPSDAFRVRKPMKSLEVTYQDLKSRQKSAPKKSFKELKIIKDDGSYWKREEEVLMKERNRPSVMGRPIRDISKLTTPLRADSKKTLPIFAIDIKDKIIITPFAPEKITNPQYVTYNDDMRATIRRNIKQKAYTYVGHADFEAGEVYLTFVLSSSGILKQVRIIDEKTSANDYLRDVALRSIRESSPFPPFPPGFDYPEFSFNLLISFRNE
jgi:outer membrane biosynthesis protein TonB